MTTARSARVIGGGLRTASVLAVLAAVSALIGVVTPATPASNSATCDWVQYQHDVTHAGDASSCSAIRRTTVSLLHPGWFFSTGGYAVTASPIVANGTVYVGDAGGTFWAIDQATGTPKWSFNILDTSNACSHADAHAPSYGEITSTATYIDSAHFADHTATVAFGGGGTIFALRDLGSSASCRWYQDVDPHHPASDMEVESSPLYDAAAGTVIVGSDANETPNPSPPTTPPGMPGLWSIEADSGGPSASFAPTLMWKYLPQTDKFDTTPSQVAADDAYVNGQSPMNGCGDVWGSPALDAGTGTVVFATGNCDSSVPPSSVYALADYGSRLWTFTEPANQYNTGSGADDDFGASPIIASVPLAATTKNPSCAPAPGATSKSVVIIGSKSGYMYALDLSGNCQGGPFQDWTVQAAQPGQLGTGPGAVGGFIGSPALGTVTDPVDNSTRQLVFATSAILSPLQGGALSGLAGGDPTTVPGTIDSTVVTDCAGALSSPSPGPLECAREASVHAIDASTGALVWQAPSAPTYAAATYSNDVVFAPSTTNFAGEAFDALTGAPLWGFPTAAADSSGTAIAQDGIFFGTGTQFGTTNSNGLPGPDTGVPPQLFGVWSLTLAPTA